MRALFLVCVVVFVFAPSYALQWISLFVASLLLLGWICSAIATEALTVARRRERITAFRHETEEIELVVENRSFLPIPFIALSDKVGNLYSPDEHATVISLFPRERRVFRYRIKGHQRGRYRLGPIRIRGADPFGFFRIDKVMDSYAHVLIYPRIPRGSLTHSRGLPAGKLLARNPVYEDLTRYRGLRPYVPGDDTRRIHWKASARTATLQTIEYLPALDVPIVILLNLCAKDYVQRHRYHAGERAIEVAASLVAHAAEIRQSVALVAAATVDVDAAATGALAGGAFSSGAPVGGAGRAVGGDDSNAGHGGSVGPRRQGQPIVLPPAPAYGRVAELLSVLADLQLDSSWGQESKQMLHQVTIPYRADVLYVGPVPPDDLRVSLRALAKTGRRVVCFYLQERDAQRPPEHEAGMSVRIIPEYGEWGIA